MPPVAVLGALIVGVVGGSRTVTLADPVVVVLAALVTVHPRVTVPAAPALNVIWLLVCPAVIVPPVIVHA